MCLTLVTEIGGRFTEGPLLGYPINTCQFSTKMDLNLDVLLAIISQDQEYTKLHVKIEQVVNGGLRKGKYCVFVRRNISRCMS